MKISNSLKSFTKEILDYAGLFPPAKLPLTDAFSNYLSYCKSDFGFILSKFICPVNQFPELLNLISTLNSDEKTINISALLTGGKTIDAFKENLENDLKLWNDFVQKSKGIINVNSAEVKIPDELISQGDPEKIASFAHYLSLEIQTKTNCKVFIFIEGSMTGNTEKNFKSLINGIEIQNLNKFSAGFKLRTGGIVPDAFPSSQQIAYCIRECLDRKVPMKFTAGLHHTYRHYDKSIEIGRAHV